MDQVFSISATSRKGLLQFLDKYTLAQLNKIPEGFSNNLIWNIGHIVVVQQMLVYRLSGLPMMVSDKMVLKYKNGAKPEQDVTQEEVDEIRSVLFVTIEQTKVDFENEVFKTFQEYTTSTGFTMKNLKDALSFNNYHEAVHTGILMSIKKFV